MIKLFIKYGILSILINLPHVIIGMIKPSIEMGNFRFRLHHTIKEGIEDAHYLENHPDGTGEIYTRVASPYLLDEHTGPQATLVKNKTNDYYLKVNDLKEKYCHPFRNLINNNAILSKPQEACEILLTDCFDRTFEILKECQARGPFALTIPNAQYAKNGIPRRLIVTALKDHSKNNLTLFIRGICGLAVLAIFAIILLHLNKMPQLEILLSYL